MAGSIETLNGTSVSWAEVDATINVTGGASFPDVDFKSIDFESKVDRAMQRGQGGQVRSKTTGQVTDTASASVYRSGLRQIMRALVSVAPDDSAGRAQLSKVRFDLVIKHSYPEDPEIYCVRILGCSLDKASYKMAEGPDSDMVDIDLNPMKIVEIINGKEVVLL